VDGQRRKLIAWLAAAPSAALLGCGGATSEESATPVQPAAAPSAPPSMPVVASSSEILEPVALQVRPQPSTPSPVETLVGPSWTPKRDGAGNVLTSDIAGLDQFVWYSVTGADAVLDSVIENPHYPKPRMSGQDGSSGIVAAWGGAAWDYDSQTMYLSGGGHGDTHECDTGVYALSARTLKFRRVVDRQPLTQFRWFDVARSTAGNPVFGDDPAFGGMALNSPLKNGVPTSVHTYDGLVWIPPQTLQTVLSRPSAKGGLFYPGTCRSVINLDDQSYSTPHFLPNPDFSYQIAVLDGSTILGPRASFNFYRFDLAQREITDWPGGTTLSQGKFLPGASSTTEFTYNHKCFCWMRERREAVSFAGNQRAVRLRYGAALDANASDWTPFHDVITLTSANGSDHLDFSAANLKDVGTNLLCAAGAHYEHATGTIWVQANPTGTSLYQVTGLGGSTWTVRKIAGTQAIATAAQGTFGRFRIATFGASKLAIRVTGTTSPIQVMRLA
jgi:hypothetical protein